MSIVELSIVELGALGELLGAVAVIVTLIFLTLQLRQSRIAMDRNSEVVLAQTYQARAESSQLMMATFADSGHVAPLIARVGGIARFDDAVLATLSEEDRVRLMAWSQSMRIGLDNQHFLFERGLLDDAYYNAAVKPVIALLAPIWTRMGTPLRPTFEALVRAAADSEPRGG